MLALILVSLIGSGLIIGVTALIGVGICVLYETFGWKSIAVLIIWIGLAICIFGLCYPYLDIVIE